jgi:fibrillarin-like pre-rRNA processing protein
MEEIQPGVYRDSGKLYTRTSSDYDVYGENQRQIDGSRYRKWDATRSKLGAGIEKGIETGIETDDSVLYLGAASGTTVSHVSDILEDGAVYAVEYSDTVARKLLELAENRENIAPILADARKPEEYDDLVPEVDVVFQDISQRDQPEIFTRNAEKYLKEGGIGLLALKVRSISSSDTPEEVLEEVKAKLEETFEIIEVDDLEPYEKEHFLIKMRKK